MSQQPRIINKIVIAVLVAHGALLLTGYSSFRWRRKTPKVSPRPLRENFFTAEKKRSPTPAMRHKKTSPKPQRKVAKVAQKPKEQIKRVPAVSKPQEEAAKTPTTPKAPVSKIASGSQVASRQNSTTSTVFPYQSLLREQLQEELEGEIVDRLEIDLTLKNTGDVLKCALSQPSESLFARVLIEKIQQKQFSPFFGEVAHHDEFTFVLELVQ